ncbi:MAG: hypothetical protein AABX85_04830 [Nanoarchaeota archaeon]
MFRADKTSGEHFVEKLGGLEIVFEGLNDTLDVRKGVIGRVARETECNAYEINFSKDVLNSGAIEARPFSVYRINKAGVDYEKALSGSVGSASGEAGEAD